MRAGTTDLLAEQAGDDRRSERRKDDGEMDTVHEPQPFMRIEFLDVDGPPVAEQHDQDGQTDRRLGGSDRQYEEHEHLPELIAQVARERDEVEVNCQQHELDAHQQQDQVLAIDEDAGDGEREQDRSDGQVVIEADHCFFSASIFTIRTRSFARTATCFEMFCTLRPGRLRIVSVIAATIANSSTTAAISNA